MLVQEEDNLLEEVSILPPRSGHFDNIFNYFLSSSVIHWCCSAHVFAFNLPHFTEMAAAGGSIQAAAGPIIMFMG